ncbi:hypothetical protein KOR34_01950 [Posidoniimonas corsicana]|uniref:DUF1570 domain-containing protein n=1 Tax=Posidoniimonas corsicana TaxID=1938618 RepID=A0A5C5V9L9_9BACT|nr:DUF1570 domain-containing protein [Posidoniimonas corsicana]TWT35306.1 hypothetical protein KOR34_01950 [Posidoniimonas corsicana]
MQKLATDDSVSHPKRRLLGAAAALLVLSSGVLAGPLVEVTYERASGEQTARGEVFAEDQQGGVCLLQDDGALLLLQSDEVVSRTDLDEPFTPAGADEIEQRLRDELGPGFDCYSTPHYVVAYSTSREYARWLSSLLERLHKAFVSYWEKQGLELTEPRFPLVVVVYADAASYQKASADELGGAGGIIGYYSLTTNRVSMYDLTGVEKRRAAAGGRTSMRDINRMVARPAVAPLVATIVHEATHQVAFNTGVMQRFADLSLWLVEGMAIYFEAPDLSSGRGWRGIGKVNYPRLQSFHRNASGWNPEKMRRLVTDDRRMRDAGTAAAAYAEAWALNYFLIKQRPDEYRSYLKQAAELKPFDELPEGVRIRTFEQHFGPVDDLSRDFYRGMLRVD